MRLQYDITATGQEQLKRVLSSVEREAERANKRSVDRSRRLWARTLVQVRQELAKTEGAAMRGRGGRGGVRGAAAATTADPGHVRRMSNISREERARLREIQRTTLAESRQANYVHKLKLRNIESEKAREIAAQKAARLKRSAMWSNTARSVGRGAASSLGNAVGTVGRLGGGLLAIGGGFAAAGAIRTEMAAQAEAAVLASKALGTPGEKRNRQQIKESVLSQGRELGQKTGLGTSGIISAVSRSTAISGRLGMGQELAPFMADVADASGAAIEDVGQTVGQVLQAMMARDLPRAQALEKTKEIIAAMMAQAKVGSIEFSDYAQQMGKAMSSTAAFKGDISDLVTTMGAVSQLSIAGAASSPEEAMTAILRFRDDIIKNSKKFAAQGINVFADKKHERLRAPEEIIVETLLKTGGALDKVSKLFNIRSAKAFGVFQNLYTEKGGGEAGKAAVLKLLETAKATMPAGEIEASAAFRRQQDDKKMAINVARFNDAVGKRLLPVLTDLMPKFEKLIPVVGDAAEAVANFAKWAIENPYHGVAALIGAKVTADITAAGLGKVLSGGITKAFTKAPIGSLTLSAAMVTATIGSLAIDTIFDAKSRAEKKAGIRGAQTQALITNAQIEAQRPPRPGAAETMTLEDVLNPVGAPTQETQKKLGETYMELMSGISRSNQVSQQGFWETLANTLTGTGPGFGAVFEAQRSQDYNKDALEQAKQINALLLKAARVQAEASDAFMQAVKSGGGEKPIPARRQSPIVNRGG